MTAADCDRCREVAAELALGIAVGDERAAALEHLTNCPACRRELNGLTAALDALMSLAPPVDPPAGFEERVLAGFTSTADTVRIEIVDGEFVSDEGSPNFGPVAARDDPQTSVAAPVVGKGRARVLIGVAAVLVATAGVFGAVALVDHDVPPSATSETATAARSDRLEGVLRTPDGSDVGRVTLDTSGSGDSQGSGAELIVSLDPAVPVGSYRVECDYESGHPYTAGVLHSSPDGLEEWRGTITVPTYDLLRVRLVSTTGGPNLEASMAS
ncbi:MAG: hypothetical protein WBF71_06495 [Microthrixaceae bacterium]